MKVKKMKWRRAIPSEDGLTAYRADLQLACDAFIYVYEGMVEWAIFQDFRTLSDGYASGVESAKADCQRAWEELLMRAFEEK